jgi:hypothetical protein
MYENRHIHASINAYKNIVKKYKFSTELHLLDHNFQNNKIYFFENEFY